MDRTLILGGTSAVAMAYARLLAAQGRAMRLAGRDADRLGTNAADLRARGSDVDVVVRDLADLSDTDDSIFAGVDRVLIAYGTLTDTPAMQADPARLPREIATNFTSAALWAERSFAHLIARGGRQLTVIGSVAGDRGRQSNYPYGAAKAGLAAYVQGLAHRAARTPGAPSVLLVKPGFIDTPMTDHLPKGGPLWASPERVAGLIARAEEKGRHEIYAPGFWRLILRAIREVPFFVLRRTGL